jgi:hypothetical protein
VHCPAVGCDSPLPGSWKDYLTGGTHPKTGMPIYECPNCHLKFSADDLKANAIPVKEGDTSVFLFDTRSKKIVFEVYPEMKFTDGSFVYVHLPQILASDPYIRCLEFISKEMTDKEILEACIEYIERSK